MTKEELKELIKAIIKEYTGTGAMSSIGLSSDDGNNVTSQRPFYDEANELEYYTNQGAPYRKDSDPFNYNRSKFTKF